MGEFSTEGHFPVSPHNFFAVHCSFSHTVYSGNRSRVEDCRDHPYMRPSPFMHLQGPLPGGVVLKDGRLAHGMDLNDPRISALHDVCNQGEELGGWWYQGEELVLEYQGEGVGVGVSG